jgi:hypothetical protein
MSEVAASLTPPTKNAKAPKEPKAAKTPKEPKAPGEPRAPRNSVAGLHIKVTGEERAAKYKGMRREIYDELKTFDGKLVSDYIAAAKPVVSPRGTKQSHMSFLMFFKKDKTVELA